MQLILVTYEKCRWGKSDNKLEHALQVFDFRKISPTTYLIEASVSSTKIYQYLRNFIADEDTLLVSKVAYPLYIHSKDEVVDWVTIKS
jgi:hypothetical protein